MKQAMITGASEGIGHIFAKELAARGYVITAVARSEQKLKALTAALGGEHRYVVADLASEAGQANAVHALGERHYDLLVNNAGIGLVGDFIDTPVEKTIAMMHLNCDAVVRLAHAFLLQAERGDALLNVASTVAYMSIPTMTTYCATKAFVTTFSEALWYEQKKRGVFVQGLCPGVTSTGFQEHAGGKASDIPAGLSETPEALVAFGLKQLDKRSTPIVISGVRNNVGAGIAKLLPRRAWISLIGKVMSKTAGA